MNHCVPDFPEMEDDYPIPTSSVFSRPRKPPIGEEDVMELMWQNGQVVVQRSSKKHNPFIHGGEAVIPSEQPVAREIRPSCEDHQQHQLFMQEDEMASWLQYPIDDASFERDLYSDLLYSAPPPQPPIATVAPPRSLPPPAPSRPPIPHQPVRKQNFGHFSRIPMKQRTEFTEKPSVTTGLESTVIESNETPAVRLESRVSHTMLGRMAAVNTESVTATGTGTSGAVELGTGTCDLTVTSSPGGSRESFSSSAEMLPASQKAAPATAAEDRKRKARETDDNECRSEDVEFGGAEAKKQKHGSASTKRCRAAEVHNLSERKRRDRINEKMRALQELIPRCNKSDKASMLDEAIEYLKSLQLQVQMMSMGCGMVPMMYPGVQQYMPAMGMGMGMGMGMDMGMNRPMVPYPTMLPGSGIPNPATATHMSPRFPMPAFHMPSVPVPDPSKIQAFNQNNPMLNSLAAQNSNQHRMQNFVDPYQQFLGQFQGQVPIQQNQTVLQPNAAWPTISKDIGNPANQQTG